jgi:hypothetical protein
MRARPSSLSLLSVVSLSALAGCTTAQQPATPRALERPEHLDVACMHLYDRQENGDLVAVVPSARPLSQCGSSASSSESWVASANRLVGFVSQGARGELALIDFTGQGTIDVERGVPGVSAIPVGANVVDVATGADGRLMFVSSADPAKPAIYAVPTERVLGPLDNATPDAARLPLAITSWPACALPEAPGAITVVPHPERPSTEAPYDLIVALPGREGRDGSGKIVVLDPRPFARGAGLDTSAGSSVAPGSLAACPVVGAISLDGSTPTRFGAVKTWGNGVDYAPVDTSAVAPPISTTCSALAPTASTTIAFEPGARPVAGAVARVDDTLFVADATLPLVHVIDLSNAAAPVEKNPLVLTKRDRTTRAFGVPAIAVGPVTRRYTRPLYAVDGEDGSVAVFEIDATVGREVQVPMRRPNPELNPLQPVDRIAFSAPVRTLAIARNDVPVDTTATGSLTASATGLLCNPSPNAVDGRGAYRDLGAAYRASDANARFPLGPTRLRGVFAFAGLTNGQVVILDVDDWDAPCRRPDPMDATANLGASPFAVPQSAPSGVDDLDPYHVPFAYVTGTSATGSPVTGEAVFPVSAPHRARSRYLLRSDASGGSRLPYLAQAPLLSDGTASLPTTGPNASDSPALRPTAPESNIADPAWVSGLTSIDPTQKKLDPLYAQASTWLPTGAAIGPRFSYEDPTTQLDQDWYAARDGALPGFGTTRGKLTVDARQTSMTLASLSGPLCERGIEDYRIGLARAQQAQRELRAAGLPAVDGLETRVTDYVQLLGDVPVQGDPWWSAPDWDEGGTCSDPAGPSADTRFDFCSRLYGSGDSAARNVQRDFPILEAYADRLTLGLFDTAGNPTASETSIPARFVAKVDANSSIWLQRARCCFAKQTAYRVRAGGQWIVSGSASGFLHHVKTRASDGACVLSCDVADRLLNGRTLEVPRPAAGTSVAAPNRRSPLAFRNPAFSFVLWAGQKPSQRGWLWQFSTRGQFIPYTWDMTSAGLSSRTVNVLLSELVPIDPFGQLAIVDAGSRGIVVFDLSTMSFATTPYL